MICVIPPKTEMSLELLAMPRAFAYHATNESCWFHCSFYTVQYRSIDIRRSPSSILDFVCLCVWNRKHKSNDRTVAGKFICRDKPVRDDRCLVFLSNHLILCQLIIYIGLVSIDYPVAAVQPTTRSKIRWICDVWATLTFKHFTEFSDCRLNDFRQLS